MSFAKIRKRPECESCQQVCPPACMQVQLGMMTRYIWQIRKLTLAQQAEVVLLHPEIASFRQWWEPDDGLGEVYEEENEWPEIQASEA